MTAFYDFFRKIALKDPEGNELVVLEADSVVDTMTIESGSGVSLGTYNENTDTFKINVDYDIFVPIGTTQLRLQDVNANTNDISLTAGSGIEISRESESELVLNSFGVAETDTLHTVAARGRVTDRNLVANGITVGVVESVAGTDGMAASDPEFIGNGTLGNLLRLSDSTITTDPYSESFEFTTEDSAGVLSYAIAIDPLETVTAYSFTLEREDPASPGTYTTVENESASSSDELIIATNSFEETFDGSVTWRLTVSASGFTQDLEVQAEFQFEVFDLAADPVLKTDNTASAIRVRNILPAENEQFDIGSSSLKFKDIYLSGNSIFLGESKISIDVDGNFEFTNNTGNKAEVDLGANDTDDLTEGTSNLYYTDTRARSAVSASDDLSYDSSTGEFSVTTYKSADFNTDFGSKSTDDLSEGTSNLYYTDSRVRGAVSAGGDLSYTSSTGEFSFTERTDQEVRDLVSASGDLSYTSSTGEFSFTERTDQEVRDLISASGDLSYSSSTGEFSVTTYKSADFNTDFGSKSTDDLTEGTSNIYYTDSRVDSHLSGGTGVTYSTGEISIGQAVATNDSVTFAGVSVSGLTSLQQTTEVLNTKTGATGTVVHDFSTGAIWYHSSISSDFTANFTNIPTADNRAINVVLVLNQGATAYIPNAVQIDGVSQTINWADTVVPTGTAEQTDIVSFTLIRQNSSWLVLGSLNTFG